ncbi:hypothetical protein [Microvirus D_HF2_273]|nr:hypothetical protein [Microvirus D_HF2_273]
MDNNNKKNNVMRRETNSYKDYEFDLEEYQKENHKLDKDIKQENYVKSVDTSVSAMVSRGIVADNSQLVYGEDVPPLSKMSLMELHKMKQLYSDKVQGLEADIKYQEENYKRLQELKAQELKDVEPKTE